MAERAKRQKLKTVRAADELAQHVRAQQQASGPAILGGIESLCMLPGHPFYDLLHRRAEYKVYWGGRGAAKSWAIAEALVRRATFEKLLIVCCREFQNSIRDSAHRLIKDTIHRLGLDDWFDVTANSIRSLHGGAEFIFKGLYNNESGIRSMEGADICWIEEAQSVSSGSWEALIPTIRKDGAEIWISFNLMDENDATYQRFVATVDPSDVNIIVHKVNYTENPYFGGKLARDMERDKLRDYHLYEHIWLGLARKISNAIVLNQKYVVRDFDEHAMWDARLIERLHYGLDWGYSQDPMALTRSFVVEVDPVDGKRRLYITHEAYGTGIDIGPDFEEFLASVPGTREWALKADSSQPGMISYVCGLGYNCTGAEKWDGSVVDGIHYLRGFHEIVIHPRCVNTASEAYMWRWKVDRKIVDEHGQPQVLPILVDAHNHAWDSVRYGHDGHIERQGDVGVWAKLSGR